MYFSSVVLLCLTIALIYKVLKIRNLCYVLDPSQLQEVQGVKLGTYGQNEACNKYKEDYE